MKFGALIKNTIGVPLCLFLIAVSLQALDGGRKYLGFCVVSEDGVCSVDKTRSVSLVLNGDEVVSVILRLAGASGDLTFREVRNVPADGSNFADWFVKEFRGLTSADENMPVTYDAVLRGAYAGLSPVLKEDYPLYDALKAVTDKLGRPVPERTVVIYGSNRKVLYEFFCYPVEEKDVV